MSTQEKHVLIAEDDTLLLSMMQRALAKPGVRVSTACNGKEAIEIIAKDLPDLLLLDLLMPLVDGFAVLQYRKDKKLQFPVVVCSNLSDKANIERCDGYEVAEYVIKSDIDDDHIVSIAEKYLR